MLYIMCFHEPRIYCMVQLKEDYCVTQYVYNTIMCVILISILSTSACFRLILILLDNNKHKSNALARKTIVLLAKMKNTVLMRYIIEH